MVHLHKMVDVQQAFHKVLLQLTTNRLFHRNLANQKPREQYSQEFLQYCMQVFYTFDTQVSFLEPTLTN